MKIKRAPLLGAIVIIILITTIVAFAIDIASDKEIKINKVETKTEEVEVAKIEIEPPQKEEPQPIVKKEATAPVAITETPNNTIYLGSFKISAYCHCVQCCGKSDGITATGTKVAANRTIAVDPKVIPLGSQVIIDGKVYVAEDTGGAIKGNRIDMYFAAHQEALNWGIQYRDVSLVQ